MARPAEKTDSVAPTAVAAGSPERTRGPSLGRRAPRRRPDMFRIGGRIRAWQFAAIAVSVFGLLALLWVLATSNEWVKPIFLPSPGDVWNRMVDLAKGGELWDDVRVSVARIMT